MLKLCRAEQVPVEPDPATSSSGPRKPSPLVVTSRASLYFSSISPTGSDSVGKLSSLQAFVGQCLSLRPASNEPYKGIMSWKEWERWRRNSSRQLGGWFIALFCLVLFYLVGFVFVFFFFFFAIAVIKTCKGCFSGGDVLLPCSLFHWFPCCPLEDLISIKIQES